MANQNLNLKIGDKIGFVVLASDVDSNDRILYFPVIEITQRDGETAYVCQFPDGSRTSPIVQSVLPYRGVQIEPVAGDKMICLSDRKEEFKAAMKRGLENELHVEADFERDSFLVVNRTNQTDYRVRLETRSDGKVWSDCECPDFSFRRRICKHQSEVLQDVFFGVTDSFGVILK